MPPVDPNTLPTSDIIQIVGVITATLVSIISIIISVVTLRQNSAMIKESTRPNVTIYFDIFQTGSPRGCFILKNFGQSPAKIVSISCNDALHDSGIFGKTTNEQLKQFEDATIAPNQKFLFPIEAKDYTGTQAIFDITYKKDLDVYSEHININVESYFSLVKTRNVSKDIDKTMSYTLQEIAERIG